YLNDQAYKTESERKKFLILNPRDQLITKTDLAKYVNSFAGIPNIVSKGAQFNFSKFAEIVEDLWKQSENNINDGYFRSAVAKAIVFKGLEKLVQTQKNTWLNGSRAAIVTYSLSLLAFHAKLNKKEIDYESIWRIQAISKSLE